MTKNTFKVGDKVRIVNDNRYLCTKVGDIAKVTKVNGHGCMLRCGPVYLRQHESNDEGYHYFFHEGQFELVKEDYNLNQMYPWNGGDCPVHPETVVEVWFRVGSRGEKQSGNYYWGCSGANIDIIAFRVVKEYVEPKVIWVNEESDGIHVAYDSEEQARGSVVDSLVTRIAVKYQEVRE